MENRKRVALHNLGCKVNNYELDLIRQSFADAGYEIVPFDEKADVYVVNTCTVTNIADRKSRQMLHRAKKENPDALVVAVGCYVETDPEGAGADPAIDLMLNNHEKQHCREAVERFLAEGKKPGREKDGYERKTDWSTPGLFLPGRTRADIKIQDGCDQFCSYCIIPFARGKITSRPEEDTLREIRGLASQGVKEVVLSGIYLSAYGTDRGEEPDEALLSLIRRISLIDGIGRIRLGSLEPRIVTDRFIREGSGIPALCPHFHLSLQSGCDRTLKAMNRRYTTAQFKESVERLREFFDRPALTADIIAGFPGETEEDFEQTCRFAEEIGFYEIHVFKYSRRAGTAADRMPGQLTEREKAERVRKLIAITKKQAQAYREQFLGQRDELLLEEKLTLAGRPFWRGHTMRYLEGLVPETAERKPFAAGLCLGGTFSGAIPGRAELLFAPDGAGEGRNLPDAAQDAVQ